MAQDWNFTTVDQPGMNGRAIPYPRGHVLGGSTCISGSLSSVIKVPWPIFDMCGRLHGNDSWLEG